MHRLILHNDNICSSSEKLVSPGQVGYMNGWGVFSTLRVKDGVLFAWERHWRRMQRDAALMRVPMPDDPEQVESALLRLVQANQAWNATLRVAIVRNRGGLFEGEEIRRDYDLVAFTADLVNWGTAARLQVAPNGRCSLLRHQSAKITSWAHNLVLYEEARQAGYDEVILLNERGELSECTSANIFVVFGDRVFTPPLSSGCLPGVTREILLQEIQGPGIQIEEAELRLEHLEQADEVFISSTTRDVLSVCAAGTRIFTVPPRVQPRLLSAFLSYQNQYVEQARRQGRFAASEPAATVR